jgi:phosphoribosyl 1,2-cyclic phosphodiesterase
VNGIFRLHVLASGSKGNASVLETPDTCILIDCGITKKLFMQGCKDLGFDPARIDAAIITHEHSDHTKGAGVILRGLRKLGLETPIYTTTGTFKASRALQEISDDFPIRLINHAQSLAIGSIGVQFVPTSHDAADPICMVFETRENGFRDVLGFVTDTGVFPDGLPGLLTEARILALESNHDADMLRTGPYPFMLKQRIASDFGHLSNDSCDAALESVLGGRMEAVIGMHLSQTNNTPRQARAGLEGVLKRNDHPARALVGSQNTPRTVS